MTGKYLSINTTFSKKVHPIKYQIQKYIGILLAFSILLEYLIRHYLYNSGIKVDILDTCGRYIKVDILDTCGAMICSYFRVAFLLFFKKIENAVYTSCQNSTLLFINAID